MHHLSTGLAVVSLLFATAPHALDDIKELLGSLRKADGAARCLKTMALVWQSTIASRATRPCWCMLK
jgi:hypothetical protein